LLIRSGGRIPQHSGFVAMNFRLAGLSGMSMTGNCAARSGESPGF